LPKTLERKLHDDRAFCLSLLCYHVNQLRIKERLEKEKEANAWKTLYKDKSSERNRNNINVNPFTDQHNPFAG
jgi:hypothetical protein